MATDINALPQYWAKPMKSRRERYGGKFAKGCMGVAVAVGGKLVGLEILGNANLWRHHEERILRSFAIDALNVPVPKRRPGQRAVYKIIQQISSIEDQAVPSAGSGIQHRMESEKLSASALEVGDCVYHLSAIV